MPILQRCGQRVFVDQTAAGAVDDTDATLCFLQAGTIEKVTRFRGQRRVQRDEIDAREQIVELVKQLDLPTAGARGGKIRTVLNKAQPESECAPAQVDSDAIH